MVVGLRGSLSACRCGPSPPGGYGRRMRKSPRTAEVTVTAPGFLIPRIVMHRCSASITTNTPRGVSARSIASAISVVRRSWTCGFFESRSTTRAIFDRPVICCALFGMYATCACPGERDQVVLAERLQRDVADHDHLVVVGALDHRDELRGVLADPGERLLVHPGHAGGRLPQSAAVGVLADPLEDQAYAFLDLRGVERVGWPEQIHRADATGEPTRRGWSGSAPRLAARPRAGDRSTRPTG